MGIVLIELATGKYPFGEARSIIDMVQTVAEADPPTLPDDGKEETSVHELMRVYMGSARTRRVFRTVV